MEEIKKIFSEILDINLIHITFSNSKQKEIVTKISIRPILLKDNLLFQISEYKETKVFHTNVSPNDILDKLPKWLTQYFKQVQIITKSKQISILVSKKGKLTIKTKNINTVNKNIDLSHNRKKQYILNEGTPIDFLVDLGIMTTEGKVVNAKYDKFKQINRFLEFIEDILPSLNNREELTVIDFGCGKSYLTFAMYYYLKELNNYNVKMIGLDLKEDVIKACNELSTKYSFNGLEFKQGNIAEFEGIKKAHMVVSLHACDTATDYALAKAIKWKADVILSVPCCQHQLNGQIGCNTLESVLKYGLIRERISALITDALRAELLESQGYKAQILEFIDMEHTPKNILIRAVKTGEKATPNTLTDYNRCKGFLNIEPILEELLK